MRTRTRNPTRLGSLVIAGLLLPTAACNLGSKTLVALQVTDAGTTANFEVPAPGTLEVWADIDVNHRDISPKAANDELPHVQDYVIDLEREGEAAVQQRCNPFNSNFARRSTEASTVGKEARRAYDGLVRGCGFAVSPGNYTVSVRSETVSPDDRISFTKNVLVLRLDE